MTLVAVRRNPFAHMLGQNLNLLETSRQHYQQAQFKLAKESALFCYNIAQSARDWSLLLESFRLALQSSLELDELASMQEKWIATQSLISETQPEIFETLNYLYVAGLMELYKGNQKEAEVFFDRALNRATDSSDRLYLARILHAKAVILAYSKSQNQIDRSFDLIEKCLLVANGINANEVSISAEILKSYLLSEQKNLGQAADLLWRVYERAQWLGFYHLIANVLFQLSRIKKELGQLESSSTFKELAKRTITPEKYPRLYRLTQAELLIDDVKTKDLNDWDLIVDADKRTVFEKNRGFINFNNQNTLFDLLCLLSENQGRRFSKVELTEKIWQQEYKASPHDNLIYVTIKRLRLLIEPDSQEPSYIMRDRMGYYIPMHIHVEIRRTQKTARINGVENVE